MKKKTIRSTVSLLLLLGVFMSSFLSAQAVQVEPRYTGISQMASTLSITSSGGAKCTGSADLRSGYTANVTVELKRDGDTIKTWTASGSGTVSASGIYYVTSGHDYVVTTTVEVKNSSGKVVETPSKDSLVSSY